MDVIKTGKLIQELRKQKGWTQKHLAEQLSVSDRTISKWERGVGYPDISLVLAISEVLEVEISSLLAGELPINSFLGGNMKKTKFYICDNCGNITMCTGNSEISCCGRKLEVKVAKKATLEEKLQVEAVETQWFVHSDHPMKKDHYVSFVALLTGERAEIVKQYPEWNL
ncbi:MAG: helix-turn-helix domain-containing protein, partial [Culicoidibacterales bacterium]